MSTNPGVTSAPAASIDSRDPVVSFPISTIVPSRIPTSADRPGVPKPSITVPPRKTRSSMAQLFSIEGAPKERERAAGNNMPDAPQPCHGQHGEVGAKLRGDDPERQAG